MWRREKRKRLIPLQVLVLGAALALPPTASAQEQIAAAPPNRYLTPEITIDQGDRVLFTNTDVADHDVLARDNGPTGKPLFRSELIGFGRTAPVEGTEYLTTGSYGFLCSIHPQMEGTLHVSSAGKPVPRPGESSLKLQVLDKSISKVKRRGALQVRVSGSGAASVRMTAVAKGRKFAQGSMKLGGAKPKTVSLPLTRTGRRLVSNARRIAVTVKAAAKDGADQIGKATAKKTLR